MSNTIHTNEHGTFIDRFYEMTPGEETIISSVDLKPGMIAVLQDDLFRDDPRQLIHLEKTDERYDYVLSRCKKNNRWFEVVSIDGVSPNNELITMIVRYSDGVLDKKTYNKSFWWIVKLASMEVSQEMYTSVEARMDLAKVVAQETSGIRGANPEQDDFELADKFLKMIEENN